MLARQCSTGSCTFEAIEMTWSAGSSAPGTGFRRTNSERQVSGGAVSHANLKGAGPTGYLAPPASMCLTPMGKRRSTRRNPQPACRRQHRGPPDYFREFAADDRSPRLRLAPVNSRHTRWTTVIARKVVGPELDGFGRRFERRARPPASRLLRRSVALGPGSAISMVHRDYGTMLARYPHIEAMIGRNFPTGPVQKMLARADHGTTRSDQPCRRRRPAAGGSRAERISLPSLPQQRRRNRARGLAGANTLLVVAAALVALSSRLPCP